APELAVQVLVEVVAGQPVARPVSGGVLAQRVGDAIAVEARARIAERAVPVAISVLAATGMTTAAVAEPVAGTDSPGIVTIAGIRAADQFEVVADVDPADGGTAVTRAGTTAGICRTGTASRGTAVTRTRAAAVVGRAGT